MIQITKQLSDISWQVPEKTYRADPALSYSTIAKYDREGFNNLDKLFEHISTPSLTLGSCVDTLITGSQEEFNNLFYVADMPSIGDKEKQVVDALYDKYHEQYSSLPEIPDEEVLSTLDLLTFQKNWRKDTRVRIIKERGAIYYSIKANAEGKQVVDMNTYYKVQQMVKALKESPATHAYFADDDPMSPIRRYYQLKFKAKLKGVVYRNMADLIIVNYETKTIIPCDLKTSSHKEWDFQESFCQWDYMIQARLYWMIIKTNLMADDYFKDFSLEDYRFIVVNKDSLKPLVWEFPLTKIAGTLVDKEGKEYRDPLEIGAELRGYLDCKPPVPNGISLDGINTINCLGIKK